MGVDRDESTTVVTGAAPSAVAALQRAATLAAEAQHNHLGAEELLAALLDAQPMPPLRLHWPENGTLALSFDELRALAHTVIPGEVGEVGPAQPATVTVTWRGPHAEELNPAVAVPAAGPVLDSGTARELSDRIQAVMEQAWPYLRGSGEHDQAPLQHPVMAALHEAASQLAAAAVAARAGDRSYADTGRVDSAPNQ